MITVLIVDDDFMVARIHRGFVQRVEGFEVVGSAQTGAEALAAVASLKQDLVLLDPYLPDIFGLDVVARLRAAGETCDVVVITAANEADAVRGAVRQGVAGHLLKPFAFPVLKQRLEAYAAERARAVGEAELTQEQIDAAFAPSASHGCRPGAISSTSWREGWRRCRCATARPAAPSAATDVSVEVIARARPRPFTSNAERPTGIPMRRPAFVVT
jgi:response regulator of citrate/malate metabolism